MQTTVNLSTLLCKQRAYVLGLPRLASNHTVKHKLHVEAAAYRGNSHTHVLAAACRVNI